MSDPSRFETLMLEHQYGLLGPDEASELEAFLATPEGEALKLCADGWTAQLKAAACQPFPDVQFSPPADNPANVVTPKRERSDDHIAIRSVWTRWAVAACLVVVFGGLGVPAGYQFIGWQSQSSHTDDLRADMKRKREDASKLEAEQTAVRDRVRKEHEQAQAAHKAAEDAYRKALDDARKSIEAKDFTVRLRGPERIQPGAPNEWQIDTIAKSGGPGAHKKIEVVVRDQKDKELLRESHEQARGTTPLKLPADFWKNVQPGSDLFLEVVAYADDDRKSVLAERIPLARPVYITHLATDKPMYKPGETIRFRSLTLDRSSFLPPTHDMNLRFVIRKPDGAPFPIAEGNGRVSNELIPIMGPDGKPVRGIGAGEYQLGMNMPGGEYTLQIVEFQEKGNRETLLDTRRFLVNNYVPDTFEKKLEFDGKTYGPGDTVQATVRVSRTAGGPMKNAKGTVIAKLANGRELYAAKDVRFEIATEQGKPASAVHKLKFKLPEDLFAKGPVLGTLSVTINDGSDTETIVRPIPFVEKDLRIEFYPESGDLVTGVASRVYFRVRTPSGKAADLKGVITDGANKVVDVSTVTDADQAGVNRGQGMFAFTPEAGKKYFLKLVSPIGMNMPTPQGFPLPTAKDDGVVLKTLDAVAEMGKPIRVQVLVGQGKKILHVGAYARGRLITHQRIEVSAGKPVEMQLQGDESLGGVTRITAFEEIEKAGEQRASLVPRAERLTYRKPGVQLNLTATPDKDRYSPAGKVKLEIGAANEKDQPTPAILMVAVVNQSVIAMADSKTDRLMPTQFLLAGEVKSPAELEHADFLLSDDKRAAPALDILLGTQGWRRFAEQNVPPTNPADKRDVDRMLVAHGLRSTPPLELYKLEAQRVASEFAPKINQASKRDAEAETAWVEYQQKTEPSYQTRIAATKAHADSLETQYHAAAADLYRFETRISHARNLAMPLFLVGLVIVGVGGLAFMAIRRGRERKTYAMAAGASFAMALVMIVGVLMSRGTPEAEQAYVKLENEKGDRINRGSGTKMPRGVQDPDVIIPVREPKMEFKPPRDKPVDNVERDRLKKLGEGVKREPANLMMQAEPVDPPAPPGGLEDEVRTMPFVVREYAHQRDPSIGEARSDFAETVLWHPVLVLPENGKATVSFQLSDDIARYQILVAGHTVDGRIGAITKTIEARKPFTVDPKLPLEVSSADVIDVPIRVVNDSEDRRAVSFLMTPKNFAIEGNGLRTPEGMKDTIDLGANEKGRKVFRIRPTILEGDASLLVVGNSDPAAEPDGVGRVVRVVPDGFPIASSISDVLEKRASGSITLPKDMVKGSLKVRFEMYPSPLADLAKGLDGLLREPNGCFEQSSSSNYPNSLILDYLKDAKQSNPEAAKRASEMLERGYAKLTAFECADSEGKAKQGFEWFGAPARPHEALTAYGLMQFADMSRVAHVDPELIQRTQNFLMAKRDGAGGFTRNSRAVDSFGRAPKHTTDAYIVWAMIESDPENTKKLDLSKEIAALKTEALNEESRGGKDAYFTALTANILLQRGDRETALKLFDRLRDKNFKAGAINGAETSITRSAGRDLEIETTALTMLGWMRSNEPRFASAVNEATRWLAQQRNANGAFGSTQSTVLALKALVLHAKKNTRAPEAGSVKLFVNGKEIGVKTFSENEIQTIGFDVVNAEELFATGSKTNVEIVTDAKNSYPFALSFAYTTLTPPGDERCAVKLETKLGRSEAVEGETVPLKVGLHNLRKTGQGMAVAIVGLPAGMKLPADMKQLTELRDQGAIGYFEVRGRELILYWRELAPEQKIDLSLELICDIPGKYRGPASRGYLYYDSDHKNWTEPLGISIQAKGPGEKVATR